MPPRRCADHVTDADGSHAALIPGPRGGTHDGLMTVTQSGLPAPGGRGRRSARVWDARAESWDAQGTDGPGFARILAAVLTAAAAAPSDRVVDLGAGTGFLTLPLAAASGSVLAVDVSQRMLDRLALAAAAQGSPAARVRVLRADLASFDLPPASVDVVVSCYALHHLSHKDKRRLLERAAAWLRPGGRLVVADMMFGRGTTRRDRGIAAQQARAMLAKGLPGAWRLLRNVVRLGLGLGEDRPAPPTFWTSAARAAGLDGVRYEPIVAEAGLLTAIKPG